MDIILEIRNIIQKDIEVNKVTMVGIAGGSCSGKSFISKALVNAVSGTILPMDDYYRGIKFMTDENFDKPDALDLQLLARHIVALKANRSIMKPIYDFKTKSFANGVKQRWEANP